MRLFRVRHSTRFSFFTPSGLVVRASDAALALWRSIG
jgi:hypothetical protein